MENTATIPAQVKEVCNKSVTYQSALTRNPRAKVLAFWFKTNCGEEKILGNKRFFPKNPVLKLEIRYLWFEATTRGPPYTPGCSVQVCGKICTCDIISDLLCSPRIPTPLEFVASIRKEANHEIHW